MNCKIYLIIILIFICSSAYPQYEISYKTVIYKEIDTTSLELLYFYPKERLESKSAPAIIFFFGGGWKTGGKTQFIQHAKYFAKRGLVSFLVDYRTESSNGTSPFEALMDAKSAIRFIRANASTFNINPDKIIASGGSAGGHLAAACAFISDYNDENDDLKISCVPNALVLFNPVIDNGPEGYGYERIGDAYHTFSPFHNLHSLKNNAPPTIFFLGSEDRHVSVETAKKYQSLLQANDNKCDLFIYEGRKHGFWNYRYYDDYKKTLLQTDEFIQAIGFINCKPSFKLK